jgi:hypothetical protein
MASLPGFGAEAGLLVTVEGRRVADLDDLEQSRKVFPQVPPATFNYCEAWRGCIRTCCDVTITYEGPYNIPKVTKH